METVGRFERRIQLLKSVTTKSPAGAPVKSFEHLCYAWASRDAVGDAAEQYTNRRMVVPNKFRYSAHFQSGIDETLRIVDEGVIFNIESVTRVDRLFIEIVAEKITE